MFPEELKILQTMHGLSMAQVISIRPRVGASATATGVDVHYMTDFGSGPATYFPMPACPLNRVASFVKDFAHPVDPIGFGLPLSCVKHYPISERGQRRNWRYTICYARRVEQHTFTMKCPSLPVEMSRSKVVAAVLRAKRQDIKEDFFENLPGITHRINQIFTSRQDEKYFPIVKRFLDSFPRDVFGAPHESFYPSLAYLSQHYGNEVYQPPPQYVRGMHFAFGIVVLSI